MANFEELSSFYRDKKVLVTGHTGFKGSYLNVILGMMGAKVYGYSLKPDTDPCLFDILYGAGMSKRNETELKIKLDSVRDIVGGITESHIADIRDFDELETYYNRVEPDIVLHLAAQPIVRESYRIPRETYEINLMGTVNLLECVRRNPTCVSFLNVTTDKVYLNEEKPGYAYKEDDRLDGADPYANSKSCSDIATHSYAASFLNAMGVSVSTARAGNVIGGGDFARDRIIPDCVRAVINREPVYIRNPHSIRPYQHVLEPLFAYLDIAMRQALDGSYAGWYNIGPDKEDCAETIGLVSLFVENYGDGASFMAEDNPGGLHEAGLLLLDNSKYKEKFGWNPNWHIDKAVSAIVNWTKAWLISDESANEELIRQIIDYVR